MDRDAIRAKFGDDYLADERTFRMGIDLRLTTRMAGRFAGRRVLETCTGAGFATIALARAAAHVVTVEIEPAHQAQARRNVERAGLLGRVTFVAGDVLDETVLAACPPVDAAFLDPDWAVTGPDHVFRFRQSNTRPPADVLLARMLALTQDVALVLPPLVDVRELEDLPVHERQSLHLDESHELYCLYFGGLASLPGVSELRA
jgi:SAM-dependent methyltransferase